MQIVIDIDDDKYHTILNHAEEILDASSFIEPKYLYLAVINGTPLPKGHGDLIDRDYVIAEYDKAYDSGESLREVIYNAPTIIDKEGEE